MHRKINLVVAVDMLNGFSKNNMIPWNFKEDLKYFQKITHNTNVIMGRKTWDTLPQKHKPLKNRNNIIVSSTMTYTSDKDKDKYQIARSFDDALNICDKSKPIFAIGGKSIYESAIDSSILDKLYITNINKDYQCDNRFPFHKLDNYNYTKLSSRLSQNEDHKYLLNYEILQVDSKKYNTNIEEGNYLNNLRNIYLHGNYRSTRNGNTYSLFNNSCDLEFDLENYRLPLLTTKKMYWKGIFEELKFFIRGKTNTNLLKDKGVNIWNANTTREFLDDNDLDHYDVGDMGPMYGFQWRHYGAEYKGMNHDYTNEGFDQLSNVIQTILKDPHNRRIMMTTFDPSKVKESVLAPCHSLIIQFYVNDDHRLSMKMYQRSADYFLGVPFNITSSALLLMIISKLTNLKPGRLYITFGDVHIYEEHIDQVKKQINRDPYEFPTIDMSSLKDTISAYQILNQMENIQFENFSLINYKCHGKLSAVMKV